MFSLKALFIAAVTAFLSSLMLSYLSLPYVLLVLPVWLIGSGLAALTDYGFGPAADERPTRGYAQAQMQYHPKLALATYLVVILLSSVFLLYVVR
ncbi:hypothetical protein A2368_04775 [Candidatus Collierbacteria bacterium RIFOXYB1_FULL_49_13]|uniref:Uncharacterized protein n=1 Tax=Candidatus Collierbacteria bacterium RIFOXYB1_FULL_49_13 TaxID=1817728 RepID=A0A1F5FFH1_9BACT|nr:MAG: hypothetical protein A2368_04775 [Candidatus Collierbacteria bacterium RIFOXYB1_FULL_49_13]